MDGMYLMRSNTPVMKFNIDEGIYCELVPELVPYQIRSSFTDLSQFSDYNSIEYRNADNNNRNLLIHFLASRVLNLDRENAKKILNAYHFSQAHDDLTRAKISIACHSVSMTDNIWIKTEGSDIEWESMNPRKCSLNQIVMHIALTGSSLTLKGIPHTPELTGQGAYAKAWTRINNEVFLLKKSSKGGNESDIEIMVSNILDKTNVPHIIYKKGKYKDIKGLCSCKVMTTDDLSIVTAEDFSCFCNKHDADFIKEALRIDAENIYKMCIIDYLCSNSDRHMRNWGFYENNNDGKLICCHPVFDNNNAFDEEFCKDLNGGESLVFLGKSQKEVAQYALKKCGFSFTDRLSKEDFLNEDLYEIFMQKASRLGLYRQIKPTFLQRVGLSAYEKYECDKIHGSDTSVTEYKQHIAKCVRDSQPKNKSKVTIKSSQESKEHSQTVSKVVRERMGISKDSRISPASKFTNNPGNKPKI